MQVTHCTNSHFLSVCVRCVRIIIVCVCVFIMKIIIITGWYEQSGAQWGQIIAIMIEPLR